MLKTRISVGEFMEIALAPEIVVEGISPANIRTTNDHAASHAKLPTTSPPAAKYG
ncbi:MAG: hypothetical protein JNJ78_01905 [Anaerolineae bacterium]|nr:hypothetical protein [Anaerolineae bacterium]